MFGVKINEFDNTLGTIKDFNRVFPNTQLSGKGIVEILNITDGQNDVYVRDIKVNDQVIAHNFGGNNFVFNEDFVISDKIRFKYYARDFNGNTLAVAYNFKQLAEKLNVTVNFVKKRFANPILPDKITERLYNITRKEL